MSEKLFPAKVEELANVLGFIEGKLEEFSCSFKNIASISLAIEEVFVNVANYAYGDKEGKVTISVDFNENSREVTFELSDCGKHFNPLEKADPDVTLSADERDIGGLGIFITKKIMDGISYRFEGGKNILTMLKKI